MIVEFEEMGLDDTDGELKTAKDVLGLLSVIDGRLVF